MSWRPRWMTQNQQRVAIVGTFMTTLWVWALLHGILSPNDFLISTPSNTTFPFHLVSYPHLAPTPINVIPDTQTLFPTHIVRHPLARGVFLVTNEVKQGEILAVKLKRDTLEIVGKSASGGAYPAYCLAISDKLLCANYDSPTISLHRLSKSSPYISHVSTFSFLIDEDEPSHPHQIILHPRLDGVFYVPDLGMNSVYVLKLDGMGIELLQTYSVLSELGEGPRHGAITPDGNHLLLAFQTSSTVSSIPINPRGYLQPTTISLPTLPSTMLNQTSSFALSDLHLHRDTIYVLNRRVLPPYTGQGDTIAMFKLHHGQIIPSGHIRLPCFQPREIKRVGRRTMLVTCVGGDGQGSGVVRIRGTEVVDYLPGMSSWGVEET